MTNTKNELFYIYNKYFDCLITKAYKYIYTYTFSLGYQAIKFLKLYALLTIEGIRILIISPTINSSWCSEKKGIEIKKQSI